MKEFILHLSHNMGTLVNRAVAIATLVAVILCAIWLISGGFWNTFMPPQDKTAPTSGASSYIDIKAQ